MVMVLVKKAIETLMDYFKEQKNQKNFSNGRFVRNVFEQLLLIQSERLDDFKIKECDIKALIEEQKKEIKASIGF